ncbi:MAG: cytochrome c maturation protein CcmE [Terriglobia bacterium]
MRKSNLKFFLGALIILGVLTWLGVSGVRETQTYYLTIAELRAQERIPERLRIAGDVVAGSIRRKEGKVHFQLEQSGERLEVVYLGTEPLPDTFVAGAQAIVSGSLGPAHVFQAHKVQAKCASKYEAKPPSAPTRTAPTS